MREKWMGCVGIREKWMGCKNSTILNRNLTKTKLDKIIVRSQLNLHKMSELGKRPFIDLCVGEEDAPAAKVQTPSFVFPMFFSQHAFARWLHRSVQAKSLVLNSELLSMNGVMEMKIGVSKKDIVGYAEEFSRSKSVLATVYTINVVFSAQEGVDETGELHAGFIGDFFEMDYMKVISQVKRFLGISPESKKDIIQFRIFDRAVYFENEALPMNHVDRIKPRVQALGIHRPPAEAQAVTILQSKTNDHIIIAGDVRFECQVTKTSKGGAFKSSISPTESLPLDQPLWVIADRFYNGEHQELVGIRHGKRSLDLATTLNEIIFDDRLHLSFEIRSTK